MQAMLLKGAQPQAVIDNSGQTPGSMTWMQYAREFRPDPKTDFMALYPDGSEVKASDLMKKDGPPFLAAKKSADPNPLQNTGALVSSYGGSLPMEAIAELFTQYTRPSGPSMTGPGPLPHLTGEGKPGLQAMPPAGTTQNMFLAIQDAMGANVAADGTITPVAKPMVFDFVRRAGADPLDDVGGPSPAGGPPTPGGLPPLGSQTGSVPMSVTLPPSGSGDAFADRFITRGDPASPTNRRLTEGLEEIVDGVAQRIGASQGGDLQSIIDWAGPKRQALQQEIAPADERSPDYGVERQPGKAGRRMTLVNADTFRQYVEPTLDFLQRNWNDVTLLNGAKPPVAAEAMREAINDPSSGANKLAYTHTMPSPDGDIPLSRVIVTPRENEPVPMALWAYPENPDDIADAKAELSRRWEEMRAVPSGDPRAVRLTAEFTADYLKLLWQVRGNESIALTLAAGYLEAKGFEMPGLAPGVALGPMAQTSTRQEFIDRFTDGSYFKAPIRPKP
jgi:hypothetical protein